MARSLAATLDAAFMLDSEVDNLSQSVEQKYAYRPILCSFLSFHFSNLGCPNQRFSFAEAAMNAISNSIVRWQILISLADST